MSSGQSNTPKSPILAAVGISFVIAIGSMIGTLDVAQVEEFATGKWLTRPLAEAQQRNTLAITVLENTVGAISKDIDFVSARVSAAIRRNEDQSFDRLAHLDAEIAALKDKIAGIQHARVAPRAAEPQREANSELTGLRSSLNDLATAHGGALAAMAKRLERIEVTVGLTTDVMSSVADPAARRAARSAETAKQIKKPPAPPAATSPVVSSPVTSQNVARPDRGHLFNVKPLSQQGAPLRLSRLPG